MPGRNRSNNKSLKGIHNSQNPVAENKSAHSSTNGPEPSTTTTATSIAPPKHFSLPEVHADNESFWEFFVTLFGLVAIGTQYLNLYRSVWWLPHSYTNTAMNFYLIDMDLVGFSVVMLSRRCIWIFFKQLISEELPAPIKSVVGNVIKVLIFSIIFGLLLWFGYNVMIKQNQFVTVLYLCYPLIVYFVAFGLKISHFLEVISWPTDKAGKLNKMVHNCSMSAESIREEVEMFRENINIRMKQILFNSMISVYYASFVPCCFAQTVLHYDITLATQHAFFVLVSSFIMYFMYCFPTRYFDILHRSAVHLGKWNKLESRSSHLPSIPWSGLSLFDVGTLVKHSKEYFKAEGAMNAAEPGNIDHSRFYTLFIKPSVVLSLTLAIQVTLVLTIIITLINTSEWYKLITLALILFANYFPLYKICREYYILETVYQIELSCKASQENKSS